MDNFSGFITILYTVILLFTIISYVFSKRLNRTQKNVGKSLYIREKEVDQEWVQKEKTSMENLKNGNIKCHLLRNSAPIYNVKNWVDEMKSFLKRPICRELFSLEGNDIDEEH